MATKNSKTTVETTTTVAAEEAPKKTRKKSSKKAEAATKSKLAKRPTATSQVVPIRSDYLELVNALSSTTFDPVTGRPLSNPRLCAKFIIEGAMAEASKRGWVDENGRLQIPEFDEDGVVIGS